MHVKYYLWHFKIPELRRKLPNFSPFQSKSNFLLVGWPISSTFTAWSCLIKRVGKNIFPKWCFGGDLRWWKENHLSGGTPSKPGQWDPWRSGGCDDCHYRTPTTPRPHRWLWQRDDATCRPIAGVKKLPCDVVDVHKFIWVFPKIWENPPKHPILMGFSIINHPFWDTPIFGNTHIE